MDNEFDIQTTTIDIQTTTTMRLQIRGSRQVMDNLYTV